MTSNRSYPIADVIFSGARFDPHKTAILTSDFKITYGELENFIVTFAIKLRERGVNHDSILALSLVDPVSIISAAIAASIIGCRFAFLKTVRDKSAIENQITHVLHDNININADDKKIICVGTWQFSAQKNISDLDKIKFSGHQSHDSVWFIGASSGSTGKPKLIGNTVEKTMRNIRKDRDLNPEQCVSILFRSDSAIGLHWMLRVFNQKGSVIIGANPKEIMQFSPDRVVGSPYLLLKLIKNLPNGTKIDSTAVSAGGDFNENFVNVILEHFNGLINRYGSAEIGHVSSRHITRDDTYPFSIGKPFDDITVEVVGEDDIVLPATQDGYLRIRCNHMINEYLNDTEIKTSAPLRSGWFYPGDIGHSTEQGEIVIVGRSDDRINIGGFKISAHSIEEVFKSVRDISSCVAFSSYTSSGFLEFSVAIEHQHNSETKIIDIINNVCLPKLPKGLQTLKLYILPEFPRNDNGKIRRPEIIKMTSSMKSHELKKLVSAL